MRRIPAVCLAALLKYLRLNVLSPGGNPVARMEVLRVGVLETVICLLL